MRGKLKPLSGQIVVVTGSGDGLGLEVARLAVKSGAAVILAGTEEAQLRAASEALNRAGGRTHPVIAEVQTAEGCDRVARAAVARFGHFDSWVDASGNPTVPGCAARALFAHAETNGGSGALVVIAQKLSRSARAEMLRTRRRVAATQIKLPRNWRHDTSPRTAAEAALHAVERPMGQMTLTRNGQRLTPATYAKKNQAVVAGFGLIALAGLAMWLGRGRLAEVARVTRPRLTRSFRPTLGSPARPRVLGPDKRSGKNLRGRPKLAKPLR